MVSSDWFRPDDSTIVAREISVPRRPYGSALSLSGGGYRAALFHCGVTRRLNELGLLSRIETITAVSGGSIFAAFLAKGVPDWPAPGAAIPDWDARVEQPLFDFVQKDIRTEPLRRRLLPRNWRQPAVQVKELQRGYESFLDGMLLTDLPDRPRYTFCATDLIFGVSWIFSRERCGSYRAGYLTPPPASWPVSLAVTASSCFPPVFGPVEIDIDPDLLKAGTYRGLDRDDLVGKLFLSDGGLYDNLGLEPVWQTHSTIYVSDAGSPFRPSRPGSPPGMLWRYSQVSGKQVSALRKRMLHSDLGREGVQGAYMGITSRRSGDDPNQSFYSDALIEDSISAVRTDLNAFTQAEIQALVNHGYLVAASRVRQLADVNGQPAPLRIPFPESMDEHAVALELLESHRRYTPKQLLAALLRGRQ